MSLYNWWKNFTLQEHDEEMQEIVDLMNKIDSDNNKRRALDSSKLAKLSEMIGNLDKNKYSDEDIKYINEKLKIYNEKRERQVSEDFGVFIRYVREKKNMTLAELSRKTGISASYINRLELAQRSSPSITIVEKLSKGLDVPFYEMAEKSGIDPDINRDKEHSVEFIGNILKNNKVSLTNMGPAMSEYETEAFMDIVGFVSNAEWGVNTEKEKEKLFKLVDNFNLAKHK